MNLKNTKLKNLTWLESIPPSNLVFENGYEPQPGLSGSARLANLLTQLGF